MRNKFLKNISILLSGNLVGQAIPVLSSFVLTRLYSPDNFAVLTYFLGITGIISAFAQGRFELAIMLPKEERKAKTLAILGMLICCLISILTFFFVVLFGSKFAALFNAEELEFFLYFIPLSLISFGVYQTSNFYLNRQSKYKKLSTAIVSKSAMSSIVNIALGLLKISPNGLVFGNISGVIVSAGVLFSAIYRDLLNDFPSIKELKEVAIEYKEFPIKSSTSILFNLLGNQIPLFLLGYFFKDNSLIGYYGLVIRLLNLPLATIGKSVSQVFYQESNSITTAKNVRLFKKTSLGLLGVIIIPGILVLTLGPILFEFGFGQEWKEAGKIAQIFMPFYMVRFIFSSQSLLLITYKKLKTEMLFNIFFFISMTSAVYYGSLQNDPYTSLKLMSIAGTSLFIILGILLLNTAKEADYEVNTQTNN